MPSKRSSAAAFTVALLCAAFGSAAHAATAPGDGSAGIVAAASGREIGAYLDHVMLDAHDPNPGFIIPCVRVFRPYFLAAQRGDSTRSVHIQITYLSGGEEFTVSDTVPLSSLE